MKSKTSAKKDPAYPDAVALTLALRHLMKEKKVFYRHLVPVLRRSESAIKRSFSQNALSVEQMSRASNFLGYTFFKLSEIANRKFAPSHHYTPAQERLLGQSPFAMYVFVRLLVGFKPADLEKDLGISSKELLKTLIKLDKVNLIQLWPGNRVSVKAQGPFIWPKGGHLESFGRNFLGVILQHFKERSLDPDEFQGLLEAREFYLPEEVFEQLKKELAELTLKYRQITTWMFHERKLSELRPVTVITGLDYFNSFERVWRAGESNFDG